MPGVFKFVVIIIIYLFLLFRSWTMESSQADDEAPRDPGALKFHQPSYTDEDFEGTCVSYDSVCYRILPQNENNHFFSKKDIGPVPFS